MNTQHDTSMLYDALRSLGPVGMKDISNSLAQKLAGSQFTPSQVKQTIAGLAKRANESTRDAFSAALGQGPAIGGAAAMALAPGSTWEGGCSGSGGGL